MEIQDQLHQKGDFILVTEVGDIPYQETIVSKYESKEALKKGLDALGVFDRGQSITVKFVGEIKKELFITATYNTDDTTTIELIEDSMSDTTA